MADLQPLYRHVFRLTNGKTLICAPRDAIRTVDRRSDQAPAETVWEVTSPAGIVHRLWPEDIVSWNVEDVA